MNKEFRERMKQRPIIATVKNLADLDSAIKSEATIVFLLSGSIFNIAEAVDKVKKAGKLIFIHIDLLDGFSKDAVALNYIAEHIKPHGIISTKNNQLKVAKSLGLLTVQRLFIIDSLSIETAIKTSQMIEPDAIEILPGIMPRITKQLSSTLTVPVIVGGLINEEDEVTNAIKNGAWGVSTSSKLLWEMKL